MAKNTDDKFRKELMETIKEKVEEMNALDNDRTSINQDKTAILAELEAKGLPKPAIKHALAYLKMDPEKRRGYDTAMQLVREACGAPLQLDMLDVIKANAARDSDPAKPQEGPQGAADGAAITH